MKYPRLSPEDEKAFLDALDGIWNAVGYDCLMATAQEKGMKEKPTEYGSLAPADQITLPRSTVIDIVTDQFAGGYNVIHDGMGRPKMPEEQFKRIRAWMLNTPGHIVDKIVAQRFSYKKYGA